MVPSATLPTGPRRGGRKKNWLLALQRPRGAVSVPMAAALAPPSMKLAGVRGTNGSSAGENEPPTHRNLPGAQGTVHFLQEQHEGTSMSWAGMWAPKFIC